jgi:putative oxygen-independent coproporphyrinogen III oxidase
VAPGPPPSAIRPRSPRARSWAIDVLSPTVLAEVPDTPLGIYLHVPFCVRRCGYCAFVTYAEGEVGDPDAHAHWAASARAELALADRVLGADRPPLTSVFVGGGTPTAVSPALLAEVLDELRRRFAVADDLEITVEANPDGLCKGQLAELRAAGVDRVSFGMQSAVPRVLELLDRTHDPERVPAAVADARAAGFDHVSLDVIYGTPGERPGDWAATVDAALACDVDHLSAYALGIESGTRLGARVRRGELPVPSDDEAADRYEHLDRRCAETGLEWYEVSNWASSPGARCRHNQLYWRNEHWWGVGPGAHSHVAGVRWWNHPQLGAWGAAANSGGSPTAGHEVLDEGQRRLERVLLGIRVAEGLPLDAVDRPDAVAGLEDDGLVRRRGERLVLTRRGRLLADLVVRRLTS